MKYFLLITLLVFFISCTKEDESTQQKKQRTELEDSDNPADTNLTPEEKFSLAMLDDFLGESEDEDLAGYLETAVYKMSLGYTGVSMVEITPAAWLVTFEKDSTSKNYLLQKFVDVKSNDYYFRMKETSLAVSDIISRPRTKIPSAE